MKLNRTQRVTRQSVNGSRNVLRVTGKEPGYEYRIVNDTGDRVAAMQERGYEIVSDQTVKIGDRRVANPTQEGSPVVASVGNGTKGYLMRIPKEFYDEDTAIRNQLVDETEKSIKRDAAAGGLVGDVSISR